MDQSGVPRWPFNKETRKEEKIREERKKVTNEKEKVEEPRVVRVS